MKSSRFVGKWKTHFFTSFKIAAAAVLAIAVAGELGLKYSASAGIITVLSIRNTKRETFQSAVNRGLAFLCALALGALCFYVLGYELWGFAVYLLFFAMLCLSAGWQEAIAMDSVLITHFLTERDMGAGMLWNEILLFSIGTAVGILVNLHLHRKDAVFTRLAEEVDCRIKDILKGMSRLLLQEDGSESGTDCFDEALIPLQKVRTTKLKDCFAHLEEALGEAERCAAENYNNAVFRKDTYELDYIIMRERQSVILREMHENVNRMERLPEQAKQVAALLERVERDYHRDNTVAGLLEELELLFMRMKEEKLPEDREEFEARAVLFYILTQIRHFLEVKSDFMKNR